MGDVHRARDTRLDRDVAIKILPEAFAGDYALGRAYARAGRTQDAARARATFRRLTEERQRAAEKTPARSDVRPPQSLPLPREFEG
jgi:hypothetical protein